jgi:MerR family transcriptional regulator/heat shock protein HspR
LDDIGLYVMSVAAELIGLHPSTLRLWERKGLLTPGRTDGGTRLYSDADIDRLRRISALTDEGVNLEGVRRILELEGRLAALQAALPDPGDIGRAAPRTFLPRPPSPRL